MPDCQRCRAEEPLLLIAKKCRSRPISWAARKLKQQPHPQAQAVGVRRDAQARQIRQRLRGRLGAVSRQLLGQLLRVAQPRVARPDQVT